MTWNYRIIKTGKAYRIHEVYYDVDGKTLWSGECCPFGESVEELKKDMNLMLLALNKPVLKVSKNKLI